MPSALLNDHQARRLTAALGLLDDLGAALERLAHVAPEDAER